MLQLFNVVRPLWLTSAVFSQFSGDSVTVQDQQAPGWSRGYPTLECVSVNMFYAEEVVRLFSALG